MMSLKSKMEFEGKDIAEAISKACKALNVSQEDLDIEVLTTGTSGIFGLCRQKARLRVALKSEEGQPLQGEKPKRQARSKNHKAKMTEKTTEISTGKKKGEEKKEPADNPREVEEKPEEDFRAGEELLADVKIHLESLLRLMQYPSDVSVSSDREYVTALIQGQYVNEIVDQNGKILDSLQYLLRKMIGKKYSEKAIISLDAGDFRATRIEELRQLGLDLAAEVKKNGKTRSIPSLNPSERRVVHLALQDDKEVRSRSVGEGLFKKVLIYHPGSKGSRKGSARRKKGARNKK
jgi:spoIIIJ-associated protein